MAAVRERISGNCKITIDDKYFVKTKKEADEILKKVSFIYSEYFSKYPDRFKE